MSDRYGFEGLVDRLVRSSRLTEREALHLIDEVTAFLGESLDDFVRRRHLELRRDGHGNPEIFARIAKEAAQRPFRVAALTERQIRRLIYG
jgi:hypothetical protein